MTHIKRINEMNQQIFLKNLDDFKIHITSVDVYDNHIKTDIKNGDVLDFGSFSVKCNNIDKYGGHYSVEIDKKDENTYVVVCIDDEGNVSCEIAFTIIYFNPNSADDIFTCMVNRSNVLR